MELSASASSNHFSPFKVGLDYKDYSFTKKKITRTIVRTDMDFNSLATRMTDWEFMKHVF